MFAHEGHYVCVCGREFTKSQSFNAHKSHCKLHLGEAKYNARMARSKQNLRYASEVVSQHKATLREAKLAQWESEEHFCIRCGRQFYKQIGSGLYCSDFCSHARPQSLETRQKIATAMNESNCIRSYHGYYKNISYASSYELIFLVYCLDHNIAIERCKYTFTYIYRGEEHVYIPDYYLPESNTIIELKSEYANKDIVQAKANSVDPAFNYKLYYGNDLAEMWQYCKSAYKVRSRKDLCEKLTLSVEDYHRLHKKEYKTTWNNGTANPAYGKHWYTNGIKNVLVKDCPAGYHKGKI